MSEISNHGSRLMQRATCSSNLEQRSNANQSYGTNDFDAWVDALLGRIPFDSVLDVCCGTGNQLVQYARLNGEADIVGVDVSEASLKSAADRMAGTARSCRLKAGAMEEMFRDQALGSARFDLISCFYGLYYSKDVTRTLEEMIGHLSAKGSLLIVGPYGKTNAALFDILQRHFTLPELVLRSATDFMQQEVLPVLAPRLQVTVETFVNPVRFPTAQSVTDYWRASTFFAPRFEAAVTRDIKRHFQLNREMVLEKHVIAYRGQLA
jgi:ubiquinone/menaquinone biosynthesis C-methylase UbiE